MTLAFSLGFSLLLLLGLAVLIELIEEFSDLDDGEEGEEADEDSVVEDAGLAGVALEDVAHLTREAVAVVSLRAVEAAGEAVPLADILLRVEVGRRSAAQRTVGNTTGGVPVGVLGAARRAGVAALDAGELALDAVPDQRGERVGEVARGAGLQGRRDEAEHDCRPDH